METPSPSKPDLTLPLKLQFQSTNTSFLADFLRHINSRVPLSNNVEYKFILLFHSVSMVISHLPRASQIKPGFMERLGTVCVCADHKFASCNFFFTTTNLYSNTQTDFMEPGRLVSLALTIFLV